MRSLKRTFGALIVAAAAFAAGRLGLLAGAPTSASPAAPIQDTDMEDLGQAMASASRPGPNHARLEPLIGDWDATFSIYPAPGAEPVVVTCSIEREWVLGGRFVKETVKGAVQGAGPFEGVGFVGYDNVDGQYEVAWVENASTGVVFETGWFDPDDEVLHFAGTRRDARTHQVIRSWSALDISSPDEHRFVAWQVGADGVRFKSAEGSANKRK